MHQIHGRHQRGLGRKVRVKNKTVPHFNMLAAQLPPVPIEIDRSNLVTGPWGMMLNGYDAQNPNAPIVGDCTVAGLFHGRQIVGAMAGKKWFQPPLLTVQQTYSAMSGYVVGKPETDVGMNEQAALNYAKTVGIAGPSGTLEKDLIWIELDPKNADHMKHAIDTCGFVYNGMSVPQLVMDQETPFFDAPPNSPIEGGHCTVNWGFRANGLYRTASWGNGDLWMTPDYVANYVDEAYVVIDPELVEVTGVTPFGLTLDELVNLASQYRE